MCSEMVTFTLNDDWKFMKGFSRWQWSVFATLIFWAIWMLRLSLFNRYAVAAALVTHIQKYLQSYCKYAVYCVINDIYMSVMAENISDCMPHLVATFFFCPPPDSSWVTDERSCSTVSTSISQPDSERSLASAGLLPTEATMWPSFDTTPC